MTGLEEYTVYKNNKKLRCGYTTGTCAAAAAKASLGMLLGREELFQISLVMPGGIELTLPVEQAHQEGNAVSCAIRKDAGDDPDVTDGLLIYARVELAEEPGIHIDGGAGVGRVTKKGLEQPIGAAAINKVPRQMIQKEIEDICRVYGYAGGVDVEIYVPGGDETAKKTFNPRLGIEGGISILGTTGIVVPMSEAAIVESMRAEMKILKAAGCKIVLITPGNYGETYARENHIVSRHQMKCSNYVGEVIDMAAELEIEGILFVAHIGKFIKVAASIMNTHSAQADGRMEIMAACGLRAGASAEVCCQVLECLTTEEALEVLERSGTRQPAMNAAVEKMGFYLDHRSKGKVKTGVILFSNQYGFLGETDNAGELRKQLQ